jgi:hypothetical protein
MTEHEISCHRKYRSVVCKRNERFFENQQRHTNGLTFTDVAIALAIE